MEAVDVDGHLVHRLHDVRRAEADRPLVAPVRDERLKPAAAARQARPSEAAGGERRPAAAEGEKSGLPGQWGFADPSDREEAD